MSPMAKPKSRNRKSSTSEPPVSAFSWGPGKTHAMQRSDSEDVADYDAEESEQQRESQAAERHRYPVGHLGDIVEELLADAAVA
jgi:hypothetical protein